MNNATQTQSRPSKRTLRQMTIGIASAVVGIGLVFAAIQFLPLLQPEEDAGQIVRDAEPLPVNLMTLQRVESIELARTYTGMIRARRRSQIGFELAGQIKEVFVDEGQRIEKGKPIAQLDTAQLQAQRDSIVAQLEQAQSVLNELNAGPRIERINSAVADVASAESEFQNAKFRLTRRESLFRSKAIPNEEYQQAVYDSKTRKAQLDAAKERLAELKSGTRSERINAQMASVRSLKATLAELDVSIRKSTLNAPYSATISQRYLDPGSIAQPSTPVVKLVEDDQLEAWIGLPVEIAMEVVLGDDYSLLIGNNQVAATVHAKIAEVDQSTRTQMVIFRIQPSSSNQVVSGQLCKAVIKSTVDAKGFWIPNSALNKGVRGLWSVLAVAPDASGTLRIRKRDIEIIRTDGQRVLAKGTIEDGNQIVADGIHRITQGQAVVDVAMKQ